MCFAMSVGSDSIITGGSTTGASRATFANSLSIGGSRACSFFRLPKNSTSFTCPYQSTLGPFSFPSIFCLLSVMLSFPFCYTPGNFSSVLSSCSFRNLSCSTPPFPSQSALPVSRSGQLRPQVSRHCLLRSSSLLSSLRHVRKEEDHSTRSACLAMGSSNPDPRLVGIAESIRAIRDFPKKGIIFRDITTLLLNHKAFKDTIDIFVERYKDKKIDVIVGIEARGFIIGPPIALAIGAKFVPQRKPKKLPGEVVRQEYSLEYGTDCIEMHVGAVQPGERCVVVDDLIATGGTLAAGIKLLERVGAEVVECACLIELVDLKGREKLTNKPLYVLVDFEGE